MDWVYKQIIGFLANFFAEMGNMGAEMFEMSWVQSIVLFFPPLLSLIFQRFSDYAKTCRHFSHGQQSLSSSKLSRT